MIVAIDLETTWLDNKKDKIIEIALVKFDENTFEILDEYTTFIYPEVAIPELISNITNIFDDDVFSAPTIDEISNKIKEFIWISPILWHNVYFDRDFLIQNNINIENNVIIDTFFLANIVCFSEKSLNLEFLCNTLWIPLVWAHRALNDVKATILLFNKLVEKFKNLSDLNKNLLYYIFSKSNDLNINFLRQYLFSSYKLNILSKEDFEKEILNIVWKYNFDNQIEYKRIQNLKENKKYKKNIDFQTIYTSLWSIEKRENQLKMTNIVYSSLNDKINSVIEAPTWVWKSFAYLIPSINFSSQYWQKVFVSTKTKVLQDQLFFKDLSFLKDKLDIDFSYTKLKWKSNYFCLQSFFEDLWEYNIEYEKISFLSKILLWLNETEFWELDELSYYSKEYYYLKFINSDSFWVLTDNNIYKNWEFLFKARQNMTTSDIIIINHSMLFSDIALENSNLWTIKNLIIDEAHSIEDSVTDSLKKSFNKKTLDEIFSSIEKKLDNKKIKKIDFLNKKDSIVDNVVLLLDYCLNYINQKVQNNNFYKTVLIWKDFFWELTFEQIITKLNLDFIDIVDLLTNISTVYEIDLTRDISWLELINKILKIVFDSSSFEEYISILNFSDYNWVSIEFTLLNPWKYLEQNLWSKVDSVILTSATLDIWDNFSYFKNILSLKDEYFKFYTFLSDFNYKEQATLFIPNNLWSVKNNSKIVIEFLKEFYSSVRWNTLTLFTSFNSIKDVYTSLNFYMKKLWINLYPQWILWWKLKLINFFLENSNNSILLWTDSFWEWVDIPGEDLKYLVIYKIPFSVPTDPIFLARSSLFKNAFTEYSIPKSIIKLKQWFWRLIRSKKDKWIVILLDDRIYSTDWWKAFYKAFPDNINTKVWSSKVFIDLFTK